MNENVKQSLKLRRFNDDRVEGDIIIVQIAKVGGMTVNTNIVDIVYHKYLTERDGWIEVRSTDRYIKVRDEYELEYVRLYSNLKISTNSPDFDKQKAQWIIDKFREYIFKD